MFFGFRFPDGCTLVRFELPFLVATVSRRLAGSQSLSLDTTFTDGTMIFIFGRMILYRNGDLTCIYPGRDFP